MALSFAESKISAGDGGFFPRETWINSQKLLLKQSLVS